MHQKLNIDYTIKGAKTLINEIYSEFCFKDEHQKLMLLQDYSPHI